MKVIVRVLGIAALACTMLVSCNNGQSLQEYYVANQEDGDFILVDVPTSLISEDTNALDDEQKRVLKTVRKINIMAFPLKTDNATRFETEKEKVNTILATDNYEELMKVNADEGSMKLYFRGEEDAIDEVIVFASQSEKGFMLARLLGDDMNIGDMMKLAQSLESGDIDVSQFDGVMDVFNDVQ